jgi:hypothetical protein
MSSNTDPQQTRQRGGSVDGLLTDQTHRRGTLGPLPQKRLANIQEQDMIERAFKHISRIISPEDDDEKMWYNLRSVWIIVDHVLQEDPNLEEHLAERDEFFDNVKRKGEQDFFKSLRDMKKDNSWERLFDDGTIHFFFMSNPLTLSTLTTFVSRCLYKTTVKAVYDIICRTRMDFHLSRQRPPCAS